MTNKKTTAPKKSKAQAKDNRPRIEDCEPSYNVEEIKKEITLETARVIMVISEEDLSEYIQGYNDRFMDKLADTPFMKGREEPEEVYNLTDFSLTRSVPMLNEMDTMVNTYRLGFTVILPKKIKL